MTEEPSLCINGCGFFSTAQTKNLCSKCYNKFLVEESAKYLATLSIHMDSAAEAAETAEAAAVAVEKRKCNRCKVCKKKVGLLGFDCRCGQVFCGSHRYPEEHSCLLDYKSSAVNKLNVQNPIIKGDKLDRL
ncbi:unnamed protein product [Cochlearia groenlandica]